MLEGDEERGARDARAERALDLFLRGQRAGTIAAELGVSESTARRWIRVALASLAAEARAERSALLARNIESQRAIARAAWEAYERERTLDEALLRGDLDRVRRRALRVSRRAAASHTPATEDDCPPVAEEEYERPKRTSQGPRYLQLALAAQREVARLQGLYARLESESRDVHVIITTDEPDPRNQPPAPEEGPTS